MNVYDFDKTIYRGDSTIDFYLHCLRRNPKIIFCLPTQVGGFVKYKLGKINKTEFKGLFFCFLKKIDDIESEVVCFWDKNENKIKEWYQKQQQVDDIIISASPFFLLEEICNRNEIQFLIASEVDYHTGEFLSSNCYGEEKVYRFKKLFPQKEIEVFYSDSHSDIPMAQLAKKAYIVKGERLSKWE